MSADPPPYDPDSLTWNEAHTTNAEHQYCYCGEDRSILDVCLQCHQCLNWFHERCLRVPLGPIVPLVTNYQLKCRRCVWRAAHPHSPRLAVPPVAPPGSRSEITPPEPMPPTPPLPSLPSPPAATVLQASPAPPPTGDTESPAILTDIPIKSSPPPTAPPSPPKSIGLAAYPTSSPLSTSSLSDLSMASSDDSSDLSSPELDPSLRDDSNIDDIPELPTLDVPTCPTESVPQPQPPSSAPDSEAAKAPTPPLVESPAPLKEISPPNVNRMTISEPAPPPPVVEPPEPAPPLDLFLEVEEEYQRTSAGWKDICATTIANLTLNYLRNHWDPDHLYSAQMETHPLPECYFNKQDIVPFVDANWKALCTFRSRTTTWWATLGSCLYTVNNVFITKDGGRRTAASDFRLMDVNLWNFRPGAIPPRPHRSAGPTALSTTPSAAKPKDSNRAKHSSKTKKRPLDSSTDPAVVEEELLAGPGTGVGAGAGAGAGDAEKAGTTVPIAPNAKAQNKSLSFAKRFAQTIGESPFGLVVPVSGTASGCPTSATSVTSPAANFPPIEVKVEPSRANPKKAPRAEKPSTTNGTGSSYFSTLAIHSPKRTVHYVDPPLDAVNEPGLVYTPCCCALPTPGNSWKTGCPPPGSLLNYYYPSTGPTTSDQPQLRSRALSYQDRNPNLKVTEGGTRVTTTGGFRSIRGVYPITDGQYFIEYFITAAQPGQGLPHVRLGFGLPQATLDGPVGCDKFGYGIRDESGDTLHNGKRLPFNPTFRTGDTIGLLISIPRLPEFDEFATRRQQAALQGRLYNSERPPILNEGIRPAMVTIQGQSYLRTGDVSSDTRPGPLAFGSAWHTPLPHPPSPCCPYTEPIRKSGPGRGKHSHKPPGGGVSSPLSTIPAGGGGFGSHHSTRGKSSAAAATPTISTQSLLPGSKIIVYKNGKCLGVAFGQLHSWLPSLPPAHNRTPGPGGTFPAGTPTGGSDWNGMVGMGLASPTKLPSGGGSGGAPRKRGPAAGSAKAAGGARPQPTKPSPTTLPTSGTPLADSPLPSPAPTFFSENSRVGAKPTTKSNGSDMAFAVPIAMKPSPAQRKDEPPSPASSGISPSTSTPTPIHNHTNTNANTFPSTSTSAVLAEYWDAARPGYYPMVSVYRGGAVVVNSGPNFRFPPPDNPEVSMQIVARSDATVERGGDPMLLDESRTWLPYSDLWVDTAVRDVTNRLLTNVLKSTGGSN